MCCKIYLVYCITISFDCIFWGVYLLHAHCALIFLDCLLLRSDSYLASNYSKRRFSETSTVYAYPFTPRTNMEVHFGGQDTIHIFRGNYWCRTVGAGIAQSVKQMGLKFIFDPQQGQDFFFLLHNTPTSSGIHSNSYTIDIWGSFAI
jgi:hypothetical protein